MYVFVQVPTAKCGIVNSLEHVRQSRERDIYVCVCDGVALVATVDREGIRGITGGGEGWGGSIS